MPKISSDWYDGRRLLKEAKKQGLEVRPGSGDHFIIRNPKTGESVTCMNRPLGQGVAIKIIKFLIKCGVVLSILLVVFQIF